MLQKIWHRRQNSRLDPTWQERWGGEYIWYTLRKFGALSEKSTIWCTRKKIEGLGALLENSMIRCTLRKFCNLVYTQKILWLDALFETLWFGAILEKKLFCAILQKFHDLCSHTVENPIIWCVRRKFYGLVHSSKFYGALLENSSINRSWHKS